MAEHIYEKSDLIKKFDNILGCTLEQIDNCDFFKRIQSYSLQKGVAGSLIERCVLGYNSDPKQEADLVVIDENEPKKIELKTTGSIGVQGVQTRLKRNFRFESK